MGEISIDPKFNIHETYKKVRILNPYRNSNSKYDFGKALSFDGVDDFANITPLTDSSFTISFWVKFKNIADRGHSPVMGSLNVSGNVMGFFNNYRLDFNIGSSGRFTIPTISVNNWYHFMLTHNTNSSRVFINGVESLSGTITGTQELSRLDLLGRQASIRYANIDLDDLVIKKGYVGTPQDAIDLYNGVDPSTILTNPDRWYKFNGNGNDSGTDASNLTLNNFIADPYVAH